MYSFYSNCPPLASTHARSRLRHSRTAESKLCWSRLSQACMIRYEDLQHHRPLFCTPFPGCIHVSYNRWDSEGHRVYDIGVSFVRSATVLELCALEHHLAGKCKIKRILEFQVENISVLLAVDFTPGSTK